MNKNRLFGAIILAFTLSCAAKQNDVDGRKAKEGKPSEIDQGKVDPNAKGKPSPDDKDLDSFAIPQNISGAYLTCALRKEASDKSLESEIGCRLTEAETGKKVAVDPKLSFANSEPFAVSSEMQAESSLYHVLYRIKGESKDRILQITQNLDVLVLYADKTFKTEKVVKVLKPAIELNDYEAPIVREQAIDKDDGGSL